MYACVYVSMCDCYFNKCTMLPCVGAVDEQQLGEMEIPDCEQPMLSQHHACLSESGAPVSAADNVTSVETGQTTSANDSASVTFRHTDLDNLPCWIGCIQLDHPYNSHTSSASNNCPSFAQPELAGVQNATEPTSVDVSCDRDINQHSPVNAKNCWDGLSDHAYESSSRDAQSLGDRSWWDHAYNIQCSTDHPSSTVSRCASVQHLDHSYDTRMSSELSYSETFLSSILDHAYFASEWTAGWRQTSGQRWSSSDDVRTASRPVPAFVS